MKYEFIFNESLSVRIFLKTIKQKNSIAFLYAIAIVGIFYIFHNSNEILGAKFDKSNCLGKSLILILKHLFLFIGNRMAYMS